MARRLEIYGVIITLFSQGKTLHLISVVSEIHVKELFAAGKTNRLVYVVQSMCPGMHEIEFMLMMAFVLFQLKQW